MKYYIFITYGIQGVGGGQCYVAGKAKYLESIGWKVFVFSEGYYRSPKDCPIDYLNKYKKYLLPELSYPLFCLPRLLTNSTLRSMKQMVGEVHDADEIVIESHDDLTALWGELLAKTLNGKHYIYTLNERYRGTDKFYEDKIDFYLFKFDRGEILSSPIILNRLFEGYRIVKDNEVEPLLIDEDPVQDVVNEKVENLKKYDFNICYIGRTVKPYFPNIVKGIGDFAKTQSSKTVQFVIVGDVDARREIIQNTKDQAPNIVVTELGTLHPLPRSLFSKVDVVIAGSGSARCSVEEGTLTIVADPESKSALGILGYDTNNSVYRDEDSVVTSFSEALNRVLINKVYQHMHFKYPHKLGVSECTKQNFRLMEKSDNNKLYYDERKLTAGTVNLRMLMCLVVQKIRFSLQICMN